MDINTVFAAIKRQHPTVTLYGNTVALEFGGGIVCLHFFGYGFGFGVGIYAHGEDEPQRYAFGTTVEEAVRMFCDAAEGARMADIKESSA